MAILAKPAQNLDPEPSAPPAELLSEDTDCAKGPEHGEEAATPLTITVDVELQSQRRERVRKLREDLHKLENIASEIEDISKRQKKAKSTEKIVITGFAILIFVVIAYVMYKALRKSPTADAGGDYNSHNDRLYNSHDRNYHISPLPEGVYYKPDQSEIDSINDRLRNWNVLLDKHKNDKN